MFLTQKNMIRGLSAQQFHALRTRCRLSKTMFNVRLYTVRQHYLAKRSHLGCQSVYQQVKNNENYKLLSTADMREQILKVVDCYFKSFVKLAQASALSSTSRTSTCPTTCQRRVISG